MQEDWTLSLQLCHRGTGDTKLLHTRQLRTLKLLVCRCRTNRFSVGKLPRAARPNTHKGSQLQDRALQWNNDVQRKTPDSTVSTTIQQKVPQGKMNGMYHNFEKKILRNH